MIFMGLEFLPLASGIEGIEFFSSSNKRREEHAWSGGLVYFFQLVLALLRGPSDSGTVRHGLWVKNALYRRVSSADIVHKNVLSSAKRSQHVFWSVIFEGCEHEKRVVICKKITTCFLRSYC